MSLIKKTTFFLLCAGVLYVQSVFSPGSHLGSEDSFSGDELSDDSDDDGMVWVSLLFGDRVLVFANGIAGLESVALIDEAGQPIGMSMQLVDLVAGFVVFDGTTFEQKAENPEDLHDETAGAIKAHDSYDGQLVGWFIPNPAK